MTQEIKDEVNIYKRLLDDPEFLKDVHRVSGRLTESLHPILCLEHRSVSWNALIWFCSSFVRRAFPDDKEAQDIFMAYFPIEMKRLVQELNTKIGSADDVG